MKHLLIILVMFIAGTVSAQQKTNSFYEEEQAAELQARSFSTMEDETMPTDPPLDDGDPTDPPAPEKLPVDDYIPVLIVVAIGIIVFNHKRYRGS